MSAIGSQTGRPEKKQFFFKGKNFTRNYYPQRLIGLISLVAVILFSASSLMCAESGENIALHKSYTCQPKPNYDMCIDNDKTHLTDGGFTKGRFWGEDTTVGWVHQKPVIITIDLGSVQPISGVMYSTAAGSAGVTWPDSINIMVSDDGKQYYDAGDLVSLTAENGKPPSDGTYKYRTDKLKTHGRYVAFVSSALPYVCVDEIEVYKGNADWVKIPFTGDSKKLSHTNIALHKSYTCQPKPNYDMCIDNDKTHLTDGGFTKGRFWGEDTTVGWVHQKPVIITIDLGSVQPISGVMYSTAAGSAGVVWPGSLNIMVSDDGIKYYDAGDLISLSAENGKPPSEGTYKYWTDKLKTHGRYVAFVSSVLPYVCVDEIEVYKGNAEWVKIPFTGEFFTDPRAYYKISESKKYFRDRLNNDILSMREVLAKSGIIPSAKKEIIDELIAVEKEMAAMLIKTEGRIIFPFNPTQEHFFRVQAMLWKAMGCPDLLVWQSGLWDPIRPVQVPPRQENVTVKVSMMQNEYRAGLVNVSNSTGNVISLKMEIKDLPGGVNPSYIVVHQVEWTDTKTGIPVAKALPYAQKGSDGFVINVYPGLTRQIWFTFHPMDIPSGNYKGTVILHADKQTINIPIEMNIYPFRFPDQPTLRLGGFDETDKSTAYDISLENRDLVVAHLREHFVDSPWGTPGLLLPGKYDKEGNMVSEPDTSGFDRWIKLWHWARHYYIFLNCADNFDNTKMNTPLFEKKVKAWVTFWANHIKKQGLKPEQFLLLIVDEPDVARGNMEVIIRWATAIHKANTGIKSWEDPTYRDPASGNQEMMNLIDVLCPNRTIFMDSDQSHRDYYANKKKQGKELEFYECEGPARLLDPYAYYKLQAWLCWQYGATGEHFWAFSDNSGGSSWNEYTAPKGGYVPFFIDVSSVTPAKEMEAIREGVEDYEYFVMLKKSVADAEKRGVKGSVLDTAKKLLTEGAGAVCFAPNANKRMWMDEKDRTAADKIRIKILDTMATLQGLK